MMGLMFIGALFLYLLFSLLLAWLGARLARWRGIAGWKVGLPVFVIMLFLVTLARSKWKQYRVAILSANYSNKESALWVS